MQAYDAGRPVCASTRLEYVGYISRVSLVRFFFGGEEFVSKHEMVGTNSTSGSALVLRPDDMVGCLKYGRIVRFH